MYIWEHEDFVAVFPSGNLGESSSIVAPGSAKNVITVGGSINSPNMFESVYCNGGFEENSFICSLITTQSKYYTIDGIAVFSSQGPTYDGRIKPDIVAPGMYLYSGDLTTCSSSSSVADNMVGDLGTSMSVPVVSGALALIRQYFMEGFFPYGYRNSASAFTPSGALLKAIVISGGHRMTGYVDKGTSDGDLLYEYASVNNGFPNNIQGFGRLQLSNVLKFENRSNFEVLIAGVSDGSYTAPAIDIVDEVHQYRLCILGDDSSVKVTVVWMDYPAEVGASKALVNDLDLYIKRTDQDGSTVGTIYGNHGSKRDSVNNVEIAYVESANFGETWDVYVSASSLPMAPQKYAIVVTGQLSSTDKSKTCDFSESWKDRGGDLVLEDESYLQDESWFSENEKFLIILGGVVAMVLFLVICNRCTKSKVRQEQFHFAEYQQGNAYQYRL